MRQIRGRALDPSDNRWLQQRLPTLDSDIVGVLNDGDAPIFERESVGQIGFQNGRVGITGKYRIDSNFLA